MARDGELDEGQEGLEDLGELGDGTGADDDADDLADDEDDGKDANPPADAPAPTAEDYARLQRKAKRQEERITRLLKAQGKTPKRNAAGGLEDDEEGDDGKGPGDDRWKTVAVKNAAAAALSAAGFSGTAKQAARLTRLLDLDGVEPDKDGVFDLEDEVADLAEEYPGLFQKTTNGARKVPRVRTAPARPGAPTDDPTARTTRALLREAGFQVGRGR